MKVLRSGLSVFRETLTDEFVLHPVDTPEHCLKPGAPGSSSGGVPGHRSKAGFFLVVLNMILNMSLSTALGSQ